MFSKIINHSRRIIILAVAAGIVLASAFVAYTPAEAHCDSENGPVATAAQQALDSGNVKIVLPYVKPEYENELRAAFTQARAVRATGGQAKTLADRYFIDTAVRLHRTGEGASYNGLTDEEVPSSILVADKAMEKGSLDGVYEMLDQAIKKSVEDKYHVVVEAREQAEKLGTVEAHRERVEAELEFEKYIYELYTMITAQGPHTEGHTH